MLSLNVDRVSPAISIQKDKSDALYDTPSMAFHRSELHPVCMVYGVYFMSSLSLSIAEERAIKIDRAIVWTFTFF